MKAFDNHSAAWCNNSRNYLPNRVQISEKFYDYDYLDFLYICSLHTKLFLFTSLSVDKIYMGVCQTVTGLQEDVQHSGDNPK